MVGLGEARNEINNIYLIDRTFVISGLAQSGKASLIYLALRNDLSTLVVPVDYSLYHTEVQFI
jgi:GTP1/Obg family GTP-binding protein